MYCKENFSVSKELNFNNIPEANASVFDVENSIKNDYLSQNNSFIIKPFVKWVGGKTQLLKKIISLLPKDYNIYIEPFIGGGALFFYLQPKRAIINDFNSELIGTYQCFTNDELFTNLKTTLDIHTKNNSREYFYEIRDLDKEINYLKYPIYVRAARTIYLNKAGFNGLYRVNQNGYFNVPYGQKINLKTYNDFNFNLIRKFFSNSNITITNQDFENIARMAKKDDFIYFDPPYDNFPDKNGFVSYTKNGFNKDDQIRLANLYKVLTNKGVKIMLSNHNTPLIRELYKEYNIHIVNAKRMINSDATKRGPVEEVIITNYEK